MPRSGRARMVRGNRISMKPSYSPGVGGVILARAVAVAVMVAAFSVSISAGAAEPVASTGASPTAQAILERYINAAGGRAALEKVRTRVTKGTMEMTALGLSGAMELRAKVPNKQVSAVQLAGFGAIREGYDGKVGWTEAPGVGVRTKSGAELARDERSKVFPRELKLAEVYEKLEAKGAAKVAGVDAWVVEGTHKSGNKPDRLYFDQKSGLLLREESTVSTALGEMVFQVDFSDYRDVDGVKVPFLVRIPKPETMGFQIRVDEVKHNVEMGDSEFGSPSR